MQISSNITHDADRIIPTPKTRRGAPIAPIASKTTPWQTASRLSEKEREA
jgi:hypothetical protein